MIFKIINYFWNYNILIINFSLLFYLNNHQDHFFFYFKLFINHLIINHN